MRFKKAQINKGETTYVNIEFAFDESDTKEMHSHMKVIVEIFQSICNKDSIKEANENLYTLTGYLTALLNSEIVDKATTDELLDFAIELTDNKIMEILNKKNTERLTERVDGKLRLTKEFPSVEDTIDILMSKLELYENIGSLEMLSSFLKK